MSLKPGVLLDATFDETNCTIATENLERTINTTEFFSNLFGMSKQDTGILPPVVRHFDQEMNTFILERTPFYANILFSEVSASARGDVLAYTLPIPWTIYQLQFEQWTMDGVEMSRCNRFQIWMRPSQLYDYEDQLVHLPVPNSFGDGTVCLGEVSETYDTSTVSRGAMITSVINNFWSSVFNTDTTHWKDEIFNLFNEGSTGGFSRDYDGALSFWASKTVEEIHSAISTLPNKSFRTLGSLIPSYNAKIPSNDENFLINRLLSYAHNGVS